VSFLCHWHHQTKAEITRKERFVIALQRLVKVILAWTQFKYVGRLRDLEAGKNCGWMAVGF